MADIFGTQGNDILLVGGNLNDRIFGFGGVDTLDGLGGNDLLLGDAGNDTLEGGSGDDLLEGGSGDDILRGELGDDTYVVDSISDTVTEAAGGGTDTVRSFVDFTLIDPDVENLILLGAGDIDGTGNASNNIITGNSGINILNGLGGNDTIFGLGGNDTLNAGSSGSDSLNGGTGDDTYIVTGGFTDTVNEGANAGTDTVNSAGSFELLDEDVENLNLTGNNNTNGTGNIRTNIIKGNSGNNTLDAGTGGNDILNGEAGNDTYKVTGTSDTVNEDPGEGTDLVQSANTFDLDDNVENLTLTGVVNSNGKGNDSDNTITGNDGDNALDGLGGNDTLIGGLGDDTLNGGAGDDILTSSSFSDNDFFRYDTGSPFNTADVGVDTITDFDTKNGAETTFDKIVLDNDTFTVLTSPVGGPLQASEFAQVANDAAAATSSAFITYSLGTDSLFYNQNGNAGGFGTGGQFAFLDDNLSLVAVDFLVQQ